MFFEEVPAWYDDIIRIDRLLTVSPVVDLKLKALKGASDGVSVSVGCTTCLR